LLDAVKRNKVDGHNRNKTGNLLCKVKNILR